MFRGNPHQDRNPFATKWRDRINIDRSLPPWRIKDDPKMYPGGTPPNPKNAYPTFPLPRREDSENWIPYGEGRWMNPSFPNEPKPFKQNLPEKFWNDGTPLNDPNMLQLLNTGASMNGPLNPEGIQLAELTQDQMSMMQNPLNNPRFGVVTREDLWNKTKAMEKKGFWGFGAQEPTTPEEFNDYYNRLLQGEQGDKGRYWIS